MHERFALPIFMLALLAIPAGAQTASPHEPQAAATRVVEGTGEAERVADSESAETLSPVREAVRSTIAIKGDARLPVEFDDHTADHVPPPARATKVQARPVPELSRAQFCSLLAQSAQEEHLPLALFARLIWQESRFDPNSVSRAGAQGVAQFMPEVAAEVGLKNPFNPLEAVPAAARFLRGLFDQFGSAGFAAAAYNAGPHRVTDWIHKGGRLPQETRSYVLKVTGRPAEQWRDASTRHVNALPPGLPCREFGMFAALDEVPDPVDDSSAAHADKSVHAMVVKTVRSGKTVRIVSVRPLKKADARIAQARRTHVIARAAAALKTIARAKIAVASKLAALAKGVAHDRKGHAALDARAKGGAAARHGGKPLKMANSKS